MITSNLARQLRAAQSVVDLLNEAIGLDEAPNLPFLSSYRVSGPHTFLLEPQALIDAAGESAFGSRLSGAQAAR
ncbi:hypothetical protein ALQ37_200144 [Pseudomonas syringae pv. aptata]|uniref:Uncharacterized protein n=1 Tax=Pseudomonas syringae pv. aptata TaxID=83167 RepID=A0A3M3XNT9_PSEAP|nr:hypothetical protein ALQ37_200144 [Pseudomonas syringae pv. aptata]